ncbi:MAG: lactonase family protein [Comamonas sp.]
MAHDPFIMLSRRHILQAGSLGVGMAAVGLGAHAASAAGAAPVFAYVGTYSDGGKPWRGGRGLGVHQFALDSRTGALVPIAGASRAVPDAAAADGVARRNPASLARHPRLPLLYAANEVERGSVSTFRIQPDGTLAFVSEVPCAGQAPAFISVHPDGRFLFTANYGSGDVSVIALQADGVPDPALPAVVYSDRLACGAQTPCQAGADVVPASASVHEGFATSDHDGPHAHMVKADPKGNFVLVADLGLDRVICYRFDRATGRLSQPQTVAVAESAGARHFIFHPNGRWFYLVTEEASTIAFMRYDDATGVLTPVSETSILPPGFKGTSYASGICMLPDGQHFVALNRLHDSIALFGVDPGSGVPTLLREEWTRGNYPRSCTLDPSGRFLYVCHNKQGDNVTVFSVHHGDIRFTGQYVAVGSAAAIEFSV